MGEISIFDELPLNIIFATILLSFIVYKPSTVSTFVIMRCNKNKICFKTTLFVMSEYITNMDNMHATYVACMLHGIYSDYVQIICNIVLFGATFLQKVNLRLLAF